MLLLIIYKEKFIEINTVYMLVITKEVNIQILYFDLKLILYYLVFAFSTTTNQI